MANCKILAVVAICMAAFCARADADPGMSWTQERAWLASNQYVDWHSIDKGLDKNAGVTVGTASINGLKGATWIVHAVLDKNDVVTEETYTIARSADAPAVQWGNRMENVLIDRMYGGTVVANEYAGGHEIATVPIYNDPGKEQFFAMTGGKFGFMLDPYEVVVFRAGELDERIKQAQYCSTHKECGE